MSIFKLKHKHFYTNLGITKKYVAFSIFHVDEKNKTKKMIISCSKLDRRNINDEEIIKLLYVLMEKIRCIYETNQRIGKNDVNYWFHYDSYLSFKHFMITKHFKISYVTSSEMLYYNHFDFCKIEIDKLDKLNVVLNFISKGVIDNRISYHIAVYLDEPMDEKTLTAKAKMSFIKTIGM